MNILFAGYKEGYLCFKSTSIVNFCWSEFSTVSGQICCTLDTFSCACSVRFYQSVDLKQRVQLCRLSEYFYTDILCDWI